MLASAGGLASPPTRYPGSTPPPPFPVGFSLFNYFSRIFLALGCVLDDGFPAYTQVSHVSNILCYAVLQSGQMCSGRSPSSAAVPHQLCCVFFSGRNSKSVRDFKTTGLINYKDKTNSCWNSKRLSRRKVSFSSGGSKETPGRRPYQSKFFHFHAALGKIFAK